AATGATECLVRGEGDDVRVGNRVRVDASGHEAGDVGGVEHEERPDFVGDLPERLRIDQARVGRGAGDDDLRSMFTGEVADLVVVDALIGRGDAVGHEVVENPAGVDRGTVGEVSALVEA